MIYKFCTYLHIQVAVNKMEVQNHQIKLLCNIFMNLHTQATSATIKYNNQVFYELKTACLHQKSNFIINIAFFTDFKRHAKSFMIPENFHSLQQIKEHHSITYDQQNPNNHNIEDRCGSTRASVLSFSNIIIPPFNFWNGKLTDQFQEYSVHCTMR